MSERAAQYLRELHRFQDRVDDGIAGLSRRLTSARMRRQAPVTIGPSPDPGPRSVSGVFLRPQVALPEPVAPPADLRGLLRAEQGEDETEVSPHGHPRAPRVGQAEEARAPSRSRSAAAVDPDGPLQSLVMRRSRIGSDYSLALLADTAVQLPVSGRPGVRQLFPSFDPGDAESFRLELSLHRLGSADPGAENRGELVLAGQALGVLVAALVTDGWPFRALPWVRQVRDLAREGLRVASDFLSVALNEANGDPPSGGGIRSGDAFLLLALDPTSGVPNGRPGARDSKVPHPVADPAAPDLSVQPEEILAAHELGASKADSGREPESSEAEQAPSPEDPTDVPTAEDRRGGAQERSFSEDEIRAGWLEYSRSEADPVEGAEERQAFPDFLAERFQTLPTIAWTPGVGRGERWRALVWFSEQTLRQKYKHAPEFGVHVRFSRAGLEAFEAAVREHVALASSRHRIEWRGTVRVAHVGGGRVVITETDGLFITGHRATGAQLRRLWAQPDWSPS